MPKQKPEKALMWTFISLNKELKTMELLAFLESNPDFKMEKSDYSDSQSFSFGRNVYNNPALLAYAQSVAPVPAKLASGFIFEQNQIFSHDNYIGNPLNQEEPTDEKVSEKKVMDFLQFDTILKNMLKGAEWTIERRDKFLANYLKLPVHYRDEAVILEHISFIKSDPSVWENFVINAARRNPILINLLIKEKLIDINEQHPRYCNTFLHHYCFYENKLDESLLVMCRDNGFNPELKNSFEHNILYMLIEKNNIEGALKFLDIFKDKIDINAKCLGKTYLHKVVLQLEKYNKLNQSSSQMFANLLTQYTQLFLELIKLQPSVDIRSGAKSKGTNIVSYIEKKISDKGLSESLKSKMLIELEFAKIQTVPSVKKFKI